MIKPPFKTVRICSAIFRRFWSNRQGGLTHLLAILLVPLLVTLGGAVDYSLFTGIRAKAENAADMAALVGVNAITIDATLGDDDQKERSRTKAAKAFDDALAANGITASRKVVTASVTGNTVSVKIEYTIPVRGGFGQFVFPGGLELKGSVQSSMTKPIYVEVLAVVDASGSMGIGAASDDQTTMKSSSLNCTVGCHSGTNHDAIARTLTKPNGQPVQLRFDVVKNALLEMVSRAQAFNGGGSDLIKMGVYKFSNDLTQVAASTTNLAAVRTAVSTMTLDSDGAGTSYKTTLDSLNAAISRGGNGTSPSDRMLFVLFFTDGVGDDVYEVGSTPHHDPNWVASTPQTAADGWNLSVLDPAWCDPLKTKRAKVMTLYMTYVVPAEYDARYTNIRSFLLPVIPDRLRSCASQSDFAFVANEPASIQLAINAMFGAVARTAHLVK